MIKVLLRQKIGEAIITAKSLDGGYETKCKIRVKHYIDKNKLPFIIWASKNTISNIIKNYKI
ncbi:hypothetical protein PL321_05360 [Caloramator sp. mosi_1]|uniref:hypothetical protein n=1 Tax=Caloramator sp. mosi_1 TaxID=3023090 RepID=UPI0023626A79|nr:hypothetical protein [Caloramator sp. mosi_1]WDC84977.1 hypothetical protein PL321_05360 [Caloramator sp. mosi_1]